MLIIQSGCCLSLSDRNSGFLLSNVLHFCTHSFVSAAGGASSGLWRLLALQQCEDMQGARSLLLGHELSRNWRLIPCGKYWLPTSEEHLPVSGGP